MAIIVWSEVLVLEMKQDRCAATCQAPFNGSGPQPADWLRWWRHLKGGASFMPSARLSGTEGFTEKGATEPSDGSAMEAVRGTHVVENRAAQ